MKLFESIKDLKAFVNAERSTGKTIAFVPTMGALHEGHISLVEAAVKDCDVCIVSVFVNPTQFNDPKDLETYPRTLEADCKLLEKAGVMAVFSPSVEEIYPEEDTRTFNVGNVAEVMEGAYRPGHFQGVMQVVSKLFDIVNPNKAFFGEKDFQQIAVIRAMQKLLKSDIEIIACPIVREESGLALSSRNQRLSEEERKIAANIYRVLKESQELKSDMSPKDLIKWVTEELNQIKPLQVEYFEIVDAESLRSINTWTEAKQIQGCITVYCDKVRLIDNISYTAQ